MKQLILLVLLVFCLRTQAATVVGTYIGYRALDSVNYEITLIVYTDCIGSPFSNPVITVTGKSSGSYTTSPNFVSSKDITGINPQCSTKSKCAGGSFPFGVLELVYQDTVDISGGACQYVFSFADCCRNSGITTGHAGSTIYNYAIVNKCYGPNTSPLPTQSPQFLLARGQDFIYNHGLVDRDTKKDSVAYKFVDLLSGPTTIVNYSGQLSAQKPITFLGFPNSTSSFPAGFHLESTTGEITFRPAKKDEYSPYCLETKEYRWVNGNPVVVGETRLEATWYVTTSNNKTPILIGQSKTACTGQQVCIDLKTSDEDTGDSTFLKIVNNNVPNSIVTITNNKKRNTGTVCWTSQEQYIRNDPYTITVEISDNACPVSAKSLRVYGFYVKSSPDTSHFEIESKTLQCAELTVKVKTKKSLPGLGYTLSPISAYFPGTLNNKTLSVLFKDTGWNKFAIIAIANGVCSSDPVIDSIYIAPYTYKLAIQVNNDTTLCDGDSVQIFAQPLNGVGPYDYTWSAGPANKNQQFILYPSQNQVFTVLVIDSNRCAATDSVKLSVLQRPEVFAGIDTTVCPGTVVKLEATLTKGTLMPIQYEWVGLDTGNTVFVTANATAKYKLNAIDPNGCRAKTDEVIINVVPVQLVSSGDQTVCYADYVTMWADVDNKQKPPKPVKYIWLTTGDTMDLITVNPTVSTDYIIKATEIGGCELYDTLQITVLPKTFVNATSSTGVCRGNTATLVILSSNGIAPVDYLWDNGQVGDTNWVTVNANTKSIVKAIDATGCVAYDTVALTALNNPNASIGPDITVCNNTTQTLRVLPANGKAPYSYSWTNGSKADSAFITVTRGATHIVKVTDANGCFGYDTIQVNIHPPTKATFQPLPTPLCDNHNPQTLLASPAGGTWAGSGVVSGNRFNPVLAGPGTHNLSYTFVDIKNCLNTDYFNTFVSKSPAVSFTTSVDTGTVPFKVQFTTTTPGLKIWDWTIINQPGNIILTSALENPEITFNFAADYDVTLIASDSFCEGSFSSRKRIQAFNPKNYIGISETNNQKYLIYPNPATSSITIEGENITTIEMYDIQGRRQQILPTELSIAKKAVDIKNIAVGIYFIKISDNFNREYNIRVSIIH